jgi:phospholipid transport system substrate-binding protein
MEALVIRFSRTLLRPASVLAIVASLSMAGVAWAGPALDAVKAKQTQLFELIGKPSTPETQKQLAALFDQMLDYPALAEASIGAEWAKLTDAQKKEFTDLLKQLVKKSYEKNLQKVLNFNIEYLGEAPADGGASLVKTKATHKTDKRELPVEIHYRVLKVGDAWKVRDIITEDVSLVEGYRSQFTKLLKDKGYAGLVEKMKEKVAKGE